MRKHEFYKSVFENFLNKIFGKLSPGAFINTFCVYFTRVLVHDNIKIKDPGLQVGQKEKGHSLFYLKVFKKGLQSAKLKTSKF